MATVVEVYSDYLCPWCYVGQVAVERLAQEYDVEVRWMPFELRPGLRAEGQRLPAHIRAFAQDPQNPLLKMAQAHHLKLIFKERIWSSRLAHEATEFARIHGKQMEYHHNVFARYWAEDEDLASVATLVAAAQQVGLDGGAMEEALRSRSQAAAVEALLVQAHEWGVTGVPLTAVRGLGISGAQPYAVFERVMAQSGVPKISV